MDGEAVASELDKFERAGYVDYIKGAEEEDAIAFVRSGSRTGSGYYNGLVLCFVG